MVHAKNTQSLKRFNWPMWTRCTRLSASAVMTLTGLSLQGKADLCKGCGKKL